MTSELQRLLEEYPDVDQADVERVFDMYPPYPLTLDLIETIQSDCD